MKKVLSWLYGNVQITKTRKWTQTHFTQWVFIAHHLRSQAWQSSDKQKFY